MIYSLHRIVLVHILSLLKQNNEYSERTNNRNENVQFSYSYQTDSW